MRSECPAELALRSDGRIVACQSACSVLDMDEYCCRGAFSTPMACLPTNYSRVFKTACPVAYSFAYDDPTSIITCSAADYIVSFCSSSTRNETQCTYHDIQVICNGASGILKDVSQVWKVMGMVFGVVIISIQVML
ncbi:thaumatin-like protein [Phtheirospermum japonicum]|uniref:Thaumatin-like protein n=1 Tax=Phtheirospermum japonicum TaxID=374723 RepID=A0A830CVT4_9LAMI|nr:thaumatin-like protein [Phtheirospermum japonicum]